MISAYRKIFDLLDRRERGRFLLLLLMILVMGMLDVVGVASILPFLAVLANPEVIYENAYLSGLYQFFDFPHDRAFLIFLGASVFVLVVVSLAFKTLTMYALMRFSTMRTYSISSRLLAGYLSRPYVWFLRRHSADLGKSILSEVDHVTGSSILPAMRLIADATVLLALALLLLLVDPMTVIAALALLGGAYLLVYFSVSPLLARIGEIRVRANGERYQTVHEAFGGIKDVKLIGLENAYANRYQAPAWRFARVSAAGNIIQTLPRHILEAVAFGGILMLVLVLLFRSEGSFQQIVPVVGLFAFAGIRMFPLMQQVYGSFSALRFGRYALDAVHKDFSENAAAFVSEAVGPLVAMPLARELELRNVQFTYPAAHKPALRGLSLSICANTTIGLVGGSGAGKTTAVDVILGLLVPDSGALLVDGVEVSETNRRGWQRAVGYVPQQIFLTDDTVAANIAFGVPPEQIDMVSVERAARIAELHDFVTRDLSLGYDTEVGERGVRLSGGQRQRIGIARALYHDPGLLVLDEATSALDNLTEQAVMDAVHNLAGAKTIIMVAHRLSTVAGCDELFLLSEGVVTARGSYDEMMSASPDFRKMAGVGASRSRLAARK